MITAFGHSLSDFQLGIGVGALLTVFAGWIVLLLALSVLKTRSE